RLAVEALDLDQLRLRVPLRVEAAGLAARPARHLERDRVDRVRVAGAARGAQGQADRAPGRDLDSADDARGQRVDRAHFPARRVEHAQAALPRLVHGVGDEAAVGGDVEALDVPAR